MTTIDRKGYRAPVAQLVEHRAAMREVVSSTPAGPRAQLVKYRTAMQEVTGSNSSQTTSQGLKITEEKVLPL